MAYTPMPSPPLFSHCVLFPEGPRAGALSNGQDDAEAGDRWRAARVPLQLSGLAAECTATPRAVCELALAQVNGDRLEAAYRRTELFERRRTLMQQWADYIAANA